MPTEYLLATGLEGSLMAIKLDTFAYRLVLDLLANTITACRNPARS